MGGGDGPGVGEDVQQHKESFRPISNSTKQVLDMNLKEKTMHTTTLLHTLSSVRLCPALVDFSNCQYCTKVSVFRHDNGIV